MRKSCEAPARLGPADLDPLRALVGDGAVDYALVVGAFHFINRIADLLHVDPEALPEPLRRFELLRRFTVWFASRLMAKMDLAPRAYTVPYTEALERAAPTYERALGRPLTDEFRTVAARPKVIEVFQLALDERDLRSSLDRATLARVQRTVEAALPASAEDTQGFHARPPDPVEAFAFVGTRYAARTTEAMIGALKRAGYDDLGVLDLAIAVADANQWARTHRLLGLAPGLFYVSDERARREA